MKPTTASTSNRSALDPQSWVDRHGDYLFRTAIGKLGRQDDAEDVVQETLLAAWRGRAGYEGRAEERTWLTAILKRKIVDRLRRSIRDDTEPLPSDDRWLDRHFTASGKWKRRPTAWLTEAPETELERAEFWITLDGCTAKLPARLHDVFVLWHLQEQSSDAVCKALRITPANLWTTLHRARVRLWSCLGKNWYGIEAKKPEPRGHR